MVIIIKNTKRKDPIAELAKIGKKAGIDKYSIKELRQIAREEAEKEALSYLQKMKK